jgi:hypothetical protein
MPAGDHGRPPLDGLASRIPDERAIGEEPDIVIGREGAQDLPERGVVVLVGIGTRPGGGPESSTMRWARATSSCVSFSPSMAPERAI